MQLTVTVNDMTIKLDPQKTIIDLLEQLQHPRIGIALAVNQSIVPKDEWATYQVQDHDTIIIFQAIAGG